MPRGHELLTFLTNISHMLIIHITVQKIRTFFFNHCYLKLLLSKLSYMYPLSCGQELIERFSRH